MSEAGAEIEKEGIDGSVAGMESLDKSKSGAWYTSGADALLPWRFHINDNKYLSK